MSFTIAVTATVSCDFGQFGCSVREKHFGHGVRYHYGLSGIVNRQDHARKPRRFEERHSMKSDPRSNDSPPRWVKVLGVIALLAVAISAGIHLAGGDMGHLMHGGMPVHDPLAEQGSHAPQP
jgi:hypothetical protein